MPETTIRAKSARHLDVLDVLFFCLCQFCFVCKATFARPGLTTAMNRRDFFRILLANGDLQIATTTKKTICSLQDAGPRMMSNSDSFWFSAVFGFKVLCLCSAVLRQNSSEKGVARFCQCLGATAAAGGFAK